MKAVNIILSITFLFLFTCKHAPHKKTTRLFNEYLQDNFNKKISNQKQYYFVIPKFVCYKCTQLMTKEIHKQLQVKKEHITIITSNPNAIYKKTCTDFNILIDQKGDLDYLDIKLSNITIFETKQEKIINIQHFSPKQLKDFRKYVEQM